MDSSAGEPERRSVSSGSNTGTPGLPDPGPTVGPQFEAPTVPAPAFTALRAVNVRNGPGTDYQVVGALRAGDSHAITAKNADGRWLEFDDSGRRGWVMASLVSQSGNLALVRLASYIVPPPTQTPSPTTSPAVLDPVLGALMQQINQARTQAGLKPLQWSAPLGAAAQTHVEDMIRNNFFSHTGSDGTEVSERMLRAGYRPTYWGEILTHVNGEAAAAFGQFWNSPHHHDIMLGDKFEDIGIAWGQDPRDGAFKYFAVVFGRQ